jgi:hypothetical protein
MSDRAIKLGRKPLMQQGSPKRNPESKAALESNQKLAILEFARISKSQVFPSLIAVKPVRELRNYVSKLTEW